MWQNIFGISILLAIVVLAALTVWESIKAEERKVDIKKESEQIEKFVYDGVGIQQMVVNCDCGDCVKARFEADEATWVAMSKVMKPAPEEMLKAARKTLDKTKKKVKKKGKKPKKPKKKPGKQPDGSEWYP